jgi:hypothetical protein
LGLSAVLLLGAGHASATKIKGRVANWQNLVNPVWTEARDPKKHGYSFREPSPTVRSDFRRLFPHIPKELCVAALSTEVQKPPKTPILIRVGGGRTTPVTIVVPPGTQLQFKNTDPFKHRLYGVGIKTFQPNDTIKGGARDWTVPAAGSFEIRDELAPSLRFWVIAEPKVAAIAYPSLKGDFRLTVEADGPYTVQAYFSGKAVGPAHAVEVKGRDLDASRTPLKVAPDKKKKGKDDDDEKKSE